MLSSIPELPIGIGKGREAKYAPIGGPMMKQIANAIPTFESAFPRLADVVTSERIALRDMINYRELFKSSQILTLQAEHCLHLDRRSLWKEGRKQMSWIGPIYRE
jgi:hypothetical protein